jgi:CheY-like chemotaxis protein/DNA-directed RNA polymerase specialized sigma24 family protein
MSMPANSDPVPTPSPAAEPAHSGEWIAQLPFLRRYARAATGSRKAGDALVRALFEAALRDAALLATISASRQGLFRGFSALWNADAWPPALHGDAVVAPNASQLERMPALCRQALLLNQLEEFPLVETAAILGTTPGEALALVREAQDDIARQPPARVLIIEDEPLIAYHLAEIVRQAGHEIVEQAATADAARDAFARYQPTLVLSDVQLADGSSGIDAIDAILRLGPVPVIFITGFPQRLLTGAGHEPAFLITKPFREDTVRATINQALFFGVSMID